MLLFTYTATYTLLIILASYHVLKGLLKITEFTKILNTGLENWVGIGMFNNKVDDDNNNNNQIINLHCNCSKYKYLTSV